jgi:cytochrome c biogenesis protein CcmG/thiol:disulfide interchange protein DsbE
MNKKKYIASNAVLLLIAVFMWMQFYSTSNASDILILGQEIPSFDMSRLLEPGKRFTDENLKGKAVMVHVWASWCKYCNVESPLIMTLATKYHIPIYGIDFKDDRDVATAYLKKKGNPYKFIGFDPGGIVAAAWEVYGTPETFIVDKNGMIQFRYTGPLTQKMIKETILPLAKELGMIKPKFRS